MLLGKFSIGGINIYFLNNFMYILLVTQLLSLKGNYKGNYFCNSQTLLLVLLAGLPPSPLFFSKTWLVGSLVKTVPLIAITILIAINSALMFSYLNFIFLKKNKKLFKNANTYKNTMVVFNPVYVSVIFALNPLLFKIV